jgi:hypothetical protein
VLVADWGANPGEDPMDPAVWRASSPFWSEQRESFMRAQKGSDDFRSQWLNVWSDDERRNVAWPIGWAVAPRSSPDVPGGLLGALEASAERTHFAASVGLMRGDGGYDLWVEQFSDLDSAVRWLNTNGAVKVAVGASLAAYVTGVSQFEVMKYGSTETAMSTAALGDAVKRGLVAHNHDERTSEETGWAKVVRTDRGLILSGKHSGGPIPGLKSAAWNLHLLHAEVREQPHIW